MARRRVPVELLDHQSVVWSSPAAFGQWCREHLGRELPFNPLADQGAYHWFCAGAEQWAALNELELQGERGFTDWVRLAEMGITRPRHRLGFRQGAF